MVDEPSDNPAIGIVLPAGPRDDVLDTVDSVLHWTPTPRAIVVVDDTGRGEAFHSTLSSTSPDVIALKVPASIPTGLHGPLWSKVGLGLRYLSDYVHPDVILRMDTDSVMTGPAAFDAAREAFSSDPRLGILGSYRVDSEGNDRDWGPARRRINAEAGSIAGWRRPPLRRELRQLLGVAKANGYEIGAHALGGAYFISPPLMNWLSAAGHLANSVLTRSSIAEDQIAGLLAFAGGFTIGDLGQPGGVLALRWRGLPAAPEQLLSAGKAIVHSVRFFEDRNEQDIRAVFAASRMDRSA